MVNGKRNSTMKKRFVFGILYAFAICSCQVEEINEIASESTPGVIREAKVFSAIIEDNTEPGTRTSLDSQGNVLWKQGDQVSIFAGSTINEQYQVTDASDGKTAASLNKVSDPGFVAGTDIDHNVAFYPYASTAAIARSAGSYVISDITLPATQTYAEGSFGNGAFPMAAVTSTTADMNLKFKNVLGGLKLQLKGSAAIASIRITGNNNEILCGEAEVTVTNGSTPSISLSDASAKTVTLDCGAGVALNSETATPFIIALPPITMTGGFTVIVTDTEGKQMEIKTTKSQTITRSSLLKMPVVVYVGAAVIPDGCVDLGLSVCWASCNLGATNPEDLGDYYAWGETTTKTEYRWTNYKYCNGTYTSMTKYSTVSEFGDNGFVDGKIMLDAEDDAATAIKGIGWRMPTISEVSELYSNTTMTLTTINGIEGYKFQSKKTGYTDSWIFIPAAGFYTGTTLVTQDSNAADYKYYADCWAKNVSESSSYCAYRIHLEYKAYDGYPLMSWYSYDSRFVGRTIRPVYDVENAGVTGISLDKHSITTVVSVSDKLKATLTRKVESSRTDYIEWTSSNPSVVSVDCYGVITAKAVGTATITARSPFGGFSDECQVTVTASTKEFVDLGLSVKWANCNLGADAPGEVGLYYQWGDTQGYGSNTSDGKVFSWSDSNNNITYKWCNGTYSTLTKYVPSSAANRYGYNKFYDNKTTLELTDDAARAALGGDSRIPTSDEWAELRDTDNCTWTPCGNGFKVQSKKTGYTDNWIFIPVAGYRYNTSVNDNGDGYYWSSNLYMPSYPFPDKAIVHSCSPRGGSNQEYNQPRSYGCNIRPVSD